MFHHVARDQCALRHAGGRARIRVNEWITAVEAHVAGWMGVLTLQLMKCVSNRIGAVVEMMLMKRKCK